MSEPMGNMLDALGLTYTPEVDELPIGAVVLTKYVDTDGVVSLRINSTPGMNFIDRLGMFKTAEQVELNGVGRNTDDDD